MEVKLNRYEDESSYHHDLPHQIETVSSGKEAIKIARKEISKVKKENRQNKGYKFLAFVIKDRYGIKYKLPSTPIKFKGEQHENNRKI